MVPFVVGGLSGLYQYALRPWQSLSSANLGGIYRQSSQFRIDVVDAMCHQPNVVCIVEVIKSFREIPLNPIWSFSICSVYFEVKDQKKECWRLDTTLPYHSCSRELMSLRSLKAITAGGVSVEFSNQLLQLLIWESCVNQYISQGIT